MAGSRMYQLTISRRSATVSELISLRDMDEHVYFSVNEKGELTTTHDDIAPEGSVTLEEITKKAAPSVRPISFRGLYNWKAKLFRIPFGI